MRQVMVCARSPMVSMPSRSKDGTGLRRLPRGHRQEADANSTAAFLGMRRRPSGLACEEAILATDLVATATPTDAGQAASRMRVRMGRAMWVGEPRRRREPATSVRSPIACSRAGVIVARIPMTWWEWSAGKGVVAGDERGCGAQGAGAWWACRCVRRAGFVGGGCDGRGRRYPADDRGRPIREGAGASRPVRRKVPCRGGSGWQVVGSPVAFGALRP